MVDIEKEIKELEGGKGSVPIFGKSSVALKAVKSCGPTID